MLVATPSIAAPTLPTFAHVPTPGDHYSPATGSAIMTLIYQMARWHAEQGGPTDVIVSRGTRHDYEVGRCIEVEPTRLARKWQKAFDIGMGRVFAARRYFGESAYRPACDAIPRDFDGVIFLHNDPVALRMFRARHPRARVCMWANNRLFDTYTRAEVERIHDACDLFIGCSQYIVRDFEQRLGRPSPKAHAILNGADVNVFRPADDSERDTDGPPVILFVGRVQPIKGPDLLIRAVALLAKRNIDFRVRIVGSSGFSATDPLTKYELGLRDLAVPLGDRVQFVPFTDRKRIVDEYRRASIMCAPSNWDEPCSLTVPEALAAGLPIVTSRRGGLPEVGEDAVLYFSPPDVDELAERLATLADPAARREWGRRARERSADLSWERQYERLAAALG